MSDFADTLSDLAALAEAVGVSPSYTDLLGVDHPVGRETLVALLTLMGLSVNTPQEIATSAARLQAEEWHRLLPPVVVRQRGERAAAAVSLPSSHQQGELAWSVDLEDGGHVAGKTPVSVLTLIASQEIDGIVHERRQLIIPNPLPLGYHRLSVTVGTATATTVLAMTPQSGWLPPAMQRGERLWGINAQLYSVRSEQQWGIGDLADLAAVARETGLRGGDVVGINPLHALFFGSPEGASPYSPSSRLFLNPLYIAIEAVPEFAGVSKAVKARLKALQATEFVNYAEVAALKLKTFEALYKAFTAISDPQRRALYQAFVAEGGSRLRLFAIHQALEEHHKGQPWHRWPQTVQDPTSPAVEAFAKKHEERVGYFLWLQFEADRQLSAAEAALKEAGGRIGLYRDLAVGTNYDGADVWIDRSAYALGARFGAPPDPLGPLGQDWGLPPLNPRMLKELAYAPFIAMLRANMRHAGALRLDHAMGLTRLFWIMPGMTAKDGVYVGYPVDDLLAIVALESHRNQCLVIGEDLGTVPDGFREKLAAHNLLAYRLFYFERWDNGLFRRPDTYPALGLATATSHDVFTIIGHWSGWDIALRHRLGLAGDTRLEDDLAHRAEDRDKLLGALVDQGVIEADFPLTPELSLADQGRLIAAVNRFLAHSPALLHVVTLDDLAGEPSQVNVPGTVDEYPNWRRRLHGDVGSLFAAPHAQATLAAVVAERPRQS